MKKAKSSWAWLIGTVIVSTVVATVAVLSFLDQRIDQRFDQKHNEAEHKPPNIPTPDTRISGIELISETTTGSGNLEVRCNCPRNKVAIGGGAEILNSGDNSFLTTNKPIVSSDGKPVGWEAKEFRITRDFTRTLKVYAICVPFRN